MILIRSLPGRVHAAQTVRLLADRRTLSKKLWRGTAEDGVEFGFELDAPLEPGAVFFEEKGVAYQVEQSSEPVLELHMPHAADEAARLGWKLGNLHTPIQVEAGRILLADEPGIRQTLDRQHLHYHTTRTVFRPLSAGHMHGHAHEHGAH